MVNETLFDNQCIIITLDVDVHLFERLRHINNAGFSIIEINTSDITVLKKIVNEFPSLRIGAGNVISTQQLEDCYQAGVHFVTSPGFLPAIAQTASIYTINYLPGIATISEAMQVIALGYHQARPYPANLSFCALLNKCLPNLKLFPAEIEWDEAEHYLNLPSVNAVSLLNPENKHLNALAASVFA